MADSRRSGDQPGIVVKNRSSSGCLIVKKKSDGVSVAGSSGGPIVFESKKGKKRPRLLLSDSESSDELLMPPRRKVAPETIRVCKSLDKGVVEESEFGRKRGRDRDDRVRRNEDGLFGRNLGQSDRKRNRLDVFEFDEYDAGMKKMRRKLLEDDRMETGGRSFLGSMAFGTSGIKREFETGSSRHSDKKKNLYIERTSSFNQGGMNRFGMDRDAGQVPISLLREKFTGDSDEPIRLQGKNGVLKVMVNKKKKVGEPVKSFDRLDAEENRSGSRIEDSVKVSVPIHPPSYLKTEVIAKPGSFVRKEKKQIDLRKSIPTKKIKVENSVSDDSDTELKLGPKRMKTNKSMKDVSSESEKTPCEKLSLTKVKEGKVKRGSGTEKQKLRERIRGMLVDAGWTIDYRPRRNRDYLDAVYINPAGTAYWSIIKAYDALMKQQQDDENEAKASGDGSPFTPLADDVLSQLTRKTRKKMEKEMKRKQRDGSQSMNIREAATRKSSSSRYGEDMGTFSHEEKLSSYLKQGGKSSKSRVNENGIVRQSSRGHSSSHHLHDSGEKPSSASDSHLLHGRKSRKLGRCTLLVRGSNKGPNSETDDFVPYAGKRTLLSWLIDSGTVQLSQKVQYMNRRQTKVMLEGWITRDGIHCGCCSKILTVSKFEIHAGSKLRQPFQNIYLESGVSLLECQIDAWNRLVESEHIGFNTVDVDGDDPNDDTCGLCGDGGDLICCDGCPSTFHQSCLDIQMLPPGDWHCPNCTCKFCGLAGGDIAQGGDITARVLLACSMCEKKYHKLCTQDMDALPVDPNISVPSFCGKKCRELFEHLQKYLGVKHELEAGFSWTLVHRTDEDSDTSLRGLPLRVECNSKLAVALTVMDECFLPIVDRRSGINLIHNVLYNSGSNFNRLNYSGFYTAILERGDELISAASIRFHGTQLAEMPYIGTRHIYRRQGMCRRLFCALESALRTLKVEKLIIPAIAELMHTWTGVFGFTPLEESLKREMRSLNMLVFPGIDMLQKLLLEEESIEENMTTSKGSKQKELKAKHRVAPELENKSDMDSSAEDGPHKSDYDHLHANAINGEVAAADFDSKCPSISSIGVHRGTCADSQSRDKLAGTASDRKCLSNSDTSHGALETGIKQEWDSPEVDMNDANAIDVIVSAHETKMQGSAEGFISAGSPSRDTLVESVRDKKCLLNSGTSHNEVEMQNKPSLDYLVEEGTRWQREGDMNDACAIDNNIAASHEPISVAGSITTDSQSWGSKQKELKAKHRVAHELENKSDMDSSAENDPHKSDYDRLHANAINGGIAAADFDSKCPSVSSIGVHKGTCADSQSRDKLVGTASNRKCLSNSDMSHGALETGIKREWDSPEADAIDVNVSVCHEVEFPVSVEGTNGFDSRSEDKLLDSASNMQMAENKSLLLSTVKESSQSCKEVDMNDANAIDVIVSALETKMQGSAEGFISAGSPSRNTLLESVCDKKCLFNSGTSHNEVEMQNKPSLDYPVEEGTRWQREGDMDDSCAVDNNIVASHEPISVVGSITTDSQSWGKFAEIAAVREHLHVSETSQDALQTKNNWSVDDDGSRRGEIIAGNTTGEVKEIPVSSSMHITSVDLNNQITCENGHKLEVISQSGSEAMSPEGSSSLHPRSIQSDVSERKTEPNSV